MDKNALSENIVYRCGNCSISFIKLNHYERHQLTHTRELRHKCDYCERSFFRASDLEKPERKHTGERPYQCKHCKQSFILFSILKTHERTHTGERSYQCKHCEQNFSHLGTLKNHERIHTGDRPYICKYCGRSFIQLTALKNHEKMHTGVQYSERSFRQADNLVYNESSRIGNGQDISCDYNGRFIDPSNLECRQMNSTVEKQYTREEREISFIAPSTVCYDQEKHHVVKEIYNTSQESELSAFTNIQHFNSSNNMDSNQNYSQNLTFCGYQFQPGPLEIENRNIVSVDMESIICKVCFYTARNKDDLDLHYLTHYNNSC